MSSPPAGVCNDIATADVPLDRAETRIGHERRIAAGEHVDESGARRGTSASVTTARCDARESFDVLPTRGEPAVAAGERERERIGRHDRRRIASGVGESTRSTMAIASASSSCVVRRPSSVAFHSSGRGSSVRQHRPGVGEGEAGAVDEVTPVRQVRFPRRWGARARCRCRQTRTRGGRTASRSRRRVIAPRAGRRRRSRQGRETQALLCRARCRGPRSATSSTVSVANSSRPSRRSAAPSGRARRGVIRRRRPPARRGSRSPIGTATCCPGRGISGGSISPAIVVSETRMRTPSCVRRSAPSTAEVIEQRPRRAARAAFRAGARSGCPRRRRGRR